jgi:hypothetical protein
MQRAAVIYQELAVGERSVVTSGLYPRGPFKSRLAERMTTLAKAEHATLEQARAWALSVLGLDEEETEPTRDTERAPAAVSDPCPQCGGQERYKGYCARCTPAQDGAA